MSWTTPTSTLSTATWVPGTAAHTWQAIAADGMSIGVKGMMVAAIRDEFEERRGPDFQYRPLLGDREPPLDYRTAGGG